MPSMRDRASIQAALINGVKGYIPNSSSVELLHEALKRVFLGESFLPNYCRPGMHLATAVTGTSFGDSVFTLYH